MFGQGFDSPQLHFIKGLSEEGPFFLNIEKFFCFKTIRYGGRADEFVISAQSISRVMITSSRKDFI